MKPVALPVALLVLTTFPTASAEVGPPPASADHTAQRATTLLDTLEARGEGEARAQQGPVEEAVLTMSLGDSLVVVDSLQRTEGRLVSRVTNLGAARFFLDATLGPDGGVESLHIVIRPWDRGPDGEPAVDVTVRPVGELLMLEEPPGAVLREIEPGTFPYVSPSLALIEQQIIHARALAGENAEATLPVWSPYGNEGQGRTWTETARFVAPDSVRLFGYEDVVSSYRIDAAGRILSGRMQPMGYTIAREEGGG